MKINYLFIAAVVVFVYFVCTKKNGKKVEGYSLTEALFFDTILALMCAIPICLVFWVFSSTVYEIRDNYKYKKNDYLLYYKDVDSSYHILVPFTNYLSNESGWQVELKSINYVKLSPGQTDGQKYWEYISKRQPDQVIQTSRSGQFCRLKVKPDYIFEKPSNSSKKSFVYVLNYK